MIKKLIKNPLFTGSMVMIVGSNFYNLAQFAYHFVAGRLLSKAYYGDLATIISLLGLIGIIQIAFSLTIVKFIASNKDKDTSVNLIKWVNYWSILIGLILLVVAALLSPLLIKFLNIQQPIALYLLGPIALLSIVVATQRSILQAELMFNRYVLSLSADAIAKVILAVVFIFLGWAVFGALIAFLIGIIFGIIVASWSLSSYLRGKRGEMPNIAPLLKYSVPVFIQGLALTSMYSTDLLLVKHFFSPSEAGIYAAVAVLGRIAFFAGSPVIQVMFPLVARRFSHGESYHNIFYLSLLLVSGIALSVVFVYFLIPSIPIGLLYGKSYLTGAPLLWWFGIFMTFLILSMLFTQFYLSIGKTKIVWLFVVAATLQPILIWFIHPNLLTVIQLSIFSAALLFFSLLVYFPYHNKKIYE